MWLMRYEYDYSMETDSLMPLQCAVHNRDWNCEATVALSNLSTDMG